MMNLDSDALSVCKRPALIYYLGLLGNVRIVALSIN